MLIALLPFTSLQAIDYAPEQTLADVSEPDPVDRYLTRFEDRVHQMLADAGVPGAAFAVIRDDALVLQSLYGRRSLDADDVVDAETVFRIASVSKTFASALTLKLAEDGHFSLDDSLQQHFPDLKFADQEQAGLITLKDVIGQRSGIVPHAYDNLLNAGKSLDHILPKFADVGFFCTPGDCYSYQNVLYGLVADIAESTTGTGYDNLITDSFFKPLGMAQASIGFEAWSESSNRASPHVRINPSTWRRTDVNPNYYVVPAAAGVNASISDMTQWLKAQMGTVSDVLTDDQRSELTTRGVRTWRELHRRYWRDILDNAHYGLGWRIYTIGGQRLNYHGGWVRGFRSNIAYSPDKGIGMVILMNAESQVISEITSEFWSEVLLPDS